MNVKSLYSKKKIIYKNYDIEVSRCVVDREVIDSFLTSNIVKFIFFDNQYDNISSDTTINDIHKFKAKYRGNTYIRLPLHVIKEEDDKYAKGISIDELNDNPDGFVVVSKHDLHYNYKEMRYAAKDKRVSFGTQLCKDITSIYNNILSGDIFKITITDNNKNKTLYDDVVYKDINIEKMIGIKDEELQEIVNNMVGQ